MHPGNRIGIPTIVPFARRKSQSHLPPQPKNREGLTTDLLQSRLNYLKNCFSTFDDFENTKNVNILKQFVLNNNVSLKQMVDQVYLYKEVAENDNKDITSVFDKEYQRAKKLNQSLKQQYQIQKKKEQKIRQQYEQQTPVARGQQQISLFEQTIFKLKKQGEQLAKRNETIGPNLMKKNFFKEFQKIHRECEGLHRQNDKLKDIIKQKKQELQILRS